MSETDTNGVARVKTAVERLAEIRAKSAEAEAAARAEKEEAEALAELEKLETIEKLKAEHVGVELFRVDTVAGLAVIRSPLPEHFDSFQRARRDPKRVDGALMILATAGTIFPPHATLLQWQKRFPALIGSLADRIIEVAGSDTEAKKL